MEYKGAPATGGGRRERERSEGRGARKEREQRESQI